MCAHSGLVRLDLDVIIIQDDDIIYSFYVTDRAVETSQLSLSEKNMISTSKVHISSEMVHTISIFWKSTAQETAFVPLFIQMNGIRYHLKNIWDFFFHNCAALLGNNLLILTSSKYFFI